MNEEVMPRLVAMRFIPKGLEFKYSNRIEMNNEDRIKLYQLITDKYEVTADEIEKEFGVNVGKQLNLNQGGNGDNGAGTNNTDSRVMNDDEYYKRYGRNKVVNYLKSLSYAK